MFDAEEEEVAASEMETEEMESDVLDEERERVWGGDTNSMFATSNTYFQLPLRMVQVSPSYRYSFNAFEYI